MPTTVELTLACGDYEITRPLKEGTVRPDGIDLKVVTAMDSPTRHWRFLRNREFDMAEVSSSSYVAARDNGLPFRAIPVFPHRRFRHGFVYINTAEGHHQAGRPDRPQGRGQILPQQRGAVAARHPAARLRRAVHRRWTGSPSSTRTSTRRRRRACGMTRVPKGKTIVGMLVDGELDAVLHPDLIKPVRDKDPRVGRLFPDYKAEEAA